MPWLLGKDGKRERIAVKLHMQICEACPRFERQMALMKQAMGRWRNYSRDEPPR